MTVNWWDGLINIIVNNSFFYTAGQFILLCLVALISLAFTKSLDETFIMATLLLMVLLFVGVFTWIWVFVLVAMFAVLYAFHS